MAEDPLQQVAKFLRETIKVEEHVVNKFQNEKIDKAAIELMTEKDLTDLGIQAKGDRLKLKAFCQSASQGHEDERSIRKRKLKEILEAGKLLRQSTSTASRKQMKTQSSAKKQTLKFEIRWKHFDEIAGYKTKRAEQGGGVRAINLRKGSSAAECLEDIKNVFFQETEISQNMDFQLADFMSKPINIEESFSPEEYKAKYNLHTPRLFLLTKDRSEEVRYSDESDTELMTPAFWSPIDTSCEPLEEDMNEQQNEPVIRTSNSQTTSLIGSSAERKILMDEIATDYNASLEADREKSLKESRKEDIRKRRESRVIDEPNETVPYVIVSVRHIQLGLIKRRFPSDCKVQAVYDWVGSLATYPEDFSLSLTHPRIKVRPDDNITLVSSSVLHMSEEDQYLIPDDISNNNLRREDISTAYQDLVTNQNITQDADDAILADVPPSPPEQIFEEDVSALGNNHSRSLLSLNDKRKRLAEEINAQECQVYEVERHSCFENLLSMYRDESMATRNITLQFKGEDASGDGVSREVYSVFWNSFVTMYCEGSSQFIFNVSAAVTPNDYVVLGRILTHQYILTGTFPVQLTEAAVQQAVCGTVTNECLISSFLMLLPRNERDVLQRALRSEESFPAPEVIDILSNYGVQRYPTRENLSNILVQVSTTELISKPFLCLCKLRDGMGPFWNAISSNEVSALFFLCTPTTDKVIDSLKIYSVDQQDQKIFQWLLRYLRSKDEQTIRRFLQFSTGTDIFLPYSTIKVRMENMSLLAMRPKAQTCFRILVIPKNYTSLSRLSDNLDFYLSNPQLWDLTD